MFKHTFKLAVMLLVLLAPNAYAEKSPNVVLIMADDLGFESVGSYGGQSYKTPNMDKLAEEGMKFERAYATPLCTNTRIQLMTGLYNNRNWKYFGILDPDTKTIGHYMQDAGYSTMIAGKWQLQSYDPSHWPGAENRRGTGMHPRDAGFDEYSLFHTGHTELKGSRYADPVIEQNDKFLADTKGKYGPDIWTDYIIDFIDRKSNDTKPFFVYYSMSLPHGPFQPTPDSKEWTDPETRHDEEVKFYGDMVEYTDKVLGRIMDSLEQQGLDEDTLVIFYSDNGTHQSVLSEWKGRKTQGGKGLTNELGIRVPLIARWKGHIPEGETTNALADSTDIIPTLLDAANIALEETPFDGQSFLPQASGVKTKGRDWVFFHHETRPGFDKDRYHLVRLALNDTYKLYEDGRLFKISEDDLYEENPILPENDNRKEHKARKELQSVLDGMKGYTHYDPASMPRPNFGAEVFSGHRFAETTGVFVMEPESVPIPQDEAWHAENYIGDFNGTGYVRALRDQPEKPEKGALAIPFNVMGQEDLWTLSIRNRDDHANSKQSSNIWVKFDDGDWMLYSTTNGKKHKGWKWSSLGNEKAIKLGEGPHKVYIAPQSQNVKVDRLVLKRVGRQLPLSKDVLPTSPYHPWFNDK